SCGAQRVRVELVKPIVVTEHVRELRPGAQLEELQPLWRLCLHCIELSLGSKAFADALDLRAPPDSRDRCDANQVGVPGEASELLGAMQQRGLTPALVGRRFRSDANLLEQRELPEENVGPGLAFLEQRERFDEFARLDRLLRVDVHQGQIEPRVWLAR